MAISQPINLKLTEGAQIETRHTWHATSVLGTDEKNNTYLMHDDITGPGRSEFFIDKYGPDMKLLSSKPLAYNQNALNKVDVYLHSFEAHGKIYFLSFDESGSKTVVKTTELNKNSLSFSPAGKVFARTDKSSRSQSMHHELVQSADKSKIALVSTTHPVSGKNKLHVSVADTTLNPIWESDIEFPVEKKEYQIRDYCVDNSGYLNFLVVASEGKRLPGSLPIVWDYSKLQWQIIQIKGAVVKTINLSVKGGDISWASIIATPSGVSVAGFYSNQIGDNVAGVFSLKINQEAANVSNENTKPIPQGFVLKKLKVKGMLEAWDLWTMDINLAQALNDGSIYVSASQKFYKISAGSNPQSFDRQLGQIYFKVNADNSIAFVNMIPKHQWYNSSFYVAPTGNFICNDALYVLFLDGEDNAKITDPDQINIWSGNKDEQACLMLAKVNGDGTYAKEMIKPASDDMKHIGPSSLTALKNNRFVFWAEPITTTFGKRWSQLFLLSPK